MSEEKPLLNVFLDWVAGLFNPKPSAAVEDEEEMISQPEPEKVDEEVEREIDGGREDPRHRGLTR